MRVIAIVNQTGGCGKTTTTVNLGGALAADGERVLIVDMDPQAHATLSFGVDSDALDENLFDVLADPDTTDQINRIIINVADRIDLAPSGIILSALEQKLASERQDTRTQRLTSAIGHLPEDYDFILIDCPPNVGLLTFNALRAAKEVIIPLETSFFAIDGVQKLLETIGLLSDRIGHDLSVRVLPTLYDGRTRYARQTLGDIRELFKDICFDSVVRQNVKLREAARQGVPISIFAPRANGATDYASVALEVEACLPFDGRGELAPTAEDATTPREVIVHFRDGAASDVRIAGDFNGWVPDKGVRSLIESEGQQRVWTKVMQLPPGTYQYRYVVDGEWRKDPSNPESVPGTGGRPNSILVVR
jgi:chromosome partitioning protein